MERVYTEMGRKMKEIRKRLGLTQEAVAEAVGVEAAYYGQLERGTKVPSLPTLLKIGECLKVDPGLLLLRGDNPKETIYQNLEGMMDPLSDRQRRFVADLLRDAVAYLKPAVRRPKKP